MISGETAESVALTLRLPREMHERLRRQAFTLRRPISDLIREAIDRAHFHTAGVWCDDCPPAYRATTEPSASDHPVTERGTTRCPRNGGIAAHIDDEDGTCSSCGERVR